MAFGEFEPRPLHTPMADINVTPLVDVMLVLLVIFIIAAPLMTGALHMELPRVDVPAGSAKPVPLEITIDAEGITVSPFSIAAKRMRPRQAGLSSARRCTISWARTCQS